MAPWFEIKRWIDKGLEVHCHVILCFYVDFFCGQKMAARRIKATALGKRLQALAALFVSSTKKVQVFIFAIDRDRCISQLPIQSCSFLLHKVGLCEIINKVRTNRQGGPTMEKMPGI